MIWDLVFGLRMVLSLFFRMELFLSKMVLCIVFLLCMCRGFKLGGIFL